MCSWPPITGHSVMKWIVLTILLCFVSMSYADTQATAVDNDTILETTSMIFNDSTRFVEELIPSDLDDVSCAKFTFAEYRRWTFVYKYDAEDVKKLLCRCKGMCKFYTVRPNMSETIREERIDALSDRNKHKFIIVVCTLAAIFLLGVSGNITTIVGLLTWTKQTSPTYGFVISLCCSDLCMLIICMPLKATEYFKFGSLFTEATCKVSYFVRDVTFISTVLTHTIISFERCYAICRPMEVRFRCTWSRARKLIVLTWLLAICLAIPTPFMMQLYLNRKTLSLVCNQQSSSFALVVVYFGYMLGILFVIPAVIMTVTYTMSCKVLWKSTMVSEKLQGNPRSQVQKSSSSIGARRRVVALLIVAMILFIMCWGPHLIIQMLEVTDQVRKFIHPENTDTFSIVGSGLTYLGSAVNPYLFMAMSSQFCDQSVCRKIICCRRATDRSRDSETERSVRSTYTSVTRAPSEPHQTYGMKD